MDDNLVDGALLEEQLGAGSFPGDVDQVVGALLALLQRLARVEHDLEHVLDLDAGLRQLRQLSN